MLTGLRGVTVVAEIESGYYCEDLKACEHMGPYGVREVHFSITRTRFDAIWLEAGKRTWGMHFCWHSKQSCYIPKSVA